MAESPPRRTNTPHEAWFEDLWVWKIKQWLQWTGWLQYLPNLLVGMGFLALAGLGALVGRWLPLTVWVPLAAAAVTLGNLAYDVATVRWGWHPAEALPQPRTDLDAFDLMRARVSCQSFQRRDLTPEHRAAVLAAAARAAEDRLGWVPIRFEYVAAPLIVWPVVGAREFLVAIMPRDYHEEAVVDVGRSLQRVVLEATRMGLGTCWIGPGADQRSVAAALGSRFDPAADHVACICALGYASRYRPFAVRQMQRSMRWRHPLPELFFTDEACTRGFDARAAPFADYGRCWEVCQWSPSSYNGQTTRARVAVEDGQVARVDFLSATASRYYAMVALGIWLANWEAGCAALGRAGRFAKAPEAAREGLPRYVISWVAGS